MGDTEPSNITLHKTKHTNSSILSCRVELDPVATSYLVVGLNGPAASLVRFYLTT